MCLDPCHDFKGTVSQPLAVPLMLWKRSYCSRNDGVGNSASRPAPCPSKECGDGAEVKSHYGSTFRAFDLGAASPNCICLKRRDKVKERSTVVALAAVCFCAAALLGDPVIALRRLRYLAAKQTVMPMGCQRIKGPRAGVNWTRWSRIHRKAPQTPWGLWSLQ